MKIPIKLLIGDQLVEDSLVWDTANVLWEEADYYWAEDDTLAFADLFNDESISLIKVLKDIKDPAKLFTDHSRSFTLPASQRNNKIFKHWYNIDIVNGIDSREFLPAAIVMNGQIHERGNLQVEGVKMSNGIPTSYKVRFYGRMAELGEKLGQDKLTDLNFDSLVISGFDPKTYFETTSLTGIKFPLSSNAKRFIVHSTNSSYAQGLANTTNIAYVDGTLVDQYGIAGSDLVGTLPVSEILNSISNKYDLGFTGVFEQPYVQNLRIWLNKLQKPSDGEFYTQQATSIIRNSYNTNAVLDSGRTITCFGYSQVSYFVEATGSWTGSGALVIKANGIEVARSTTSGTPAVAPETMSTTNYTFFIESDSIQNVPIDIEVTQREWQYAYGYTDTVDTFNDTVSVAGADEYRVENYIPEVKVMDFLRTLFQMFNVVAELDSNNNIVTKHFDAFMAEGNVIDVTKHVIVDDYDVNRPNLFSSMEFKFKENSTSSAYGYLQVNGKNFGDLTYQLETGNNNRFVGSNYEIKTNASILPLENLTDVADNELSNYIYAHFGDVDAKAQQIGLAFTYLHQDPSTGGSIAWNNGTSIDEITDYLVPSNMYSVGSPTQFSSEVYVKLGYDEELNPLSTTHSFNGSALYSQFYRGVTSLMFDENKRNVELNAYLTPSILKDLNLNDVLVIGNKYFHINSFETDYLTGISKLDLTLVGLQKHTDFETFSSTITSTNAGRVIYLGTDGFIHSDLINSTPLTINHIGEIRCISSGSYSIS